MDLFLDFAHRFLAHDFVEDILPGGARHLYTFLAPNSSLHVLWPQTSEGARQRGPLAASEGFSAPSVEFSRFSRFFSGVSNFPFFSSLMGRTRGLSSSESDEDRLLSDSESSL